ncbi:MAG: hypothetical protein AABZ74_07170 [Cyanobacteriota bacterium]
MNDIPTDIPANTSIYINVINNKTINTKRMPLKKLISYNYQEKINNNIIPMQIDNSIFVKNIDEIKKMVNEIIVESYPKLKKANISFKTLKDDSFYFQSTFDFMSILKKNFDYIIMVNTNLFEKNCSKEAVKAILAHELSHTLDYELKGNMGVLKIGLKMLFDDSRDKYEHKTDLKAISKGYGNGLIEYRNWIYKNIPEKSIAEKKKTYYQPEEIEAIKSAFDKAEKVGKKNKLLSKWLKCPPIGIEKINYDSNKLGL